MLSDNETRSRVRQEFSSNVLLRAGAGAGKTEELTRRATHWLIYGAEGAFDPVIRQQGLVMLTFTNAAAAQMGDRLERHLHALTTDAGYLQGDQPGLVGIGYEIQTVSGLERAEIEARAEALLNGAPFRVNTFHSFCLDLIAQYGDSARLPADLKLETVPRRLSIARRHAAWGAIENALGEGGRLTLDASLRLDWLVDVIEILACSPWLPRSELSRLDELFEAQDFMAVIEQAPAVQAELLAAAQDLMPLIKRGKQHIELANALGQAPADWSGAYGALKKLVDQAGTAKHPEILQRLNARLPEAAVLSLWKSGFWEVLLSHLPELVLDARRLAVAAGTIGFDDALRMAVEMLEGSPRLRRRASKPILQMMVDEFQDTDPLQVRLLHLLHDDDEGVLQPGRLFIVGDHKQSIYRFRGADVQVYQAFSQRMVDDGALQLKLTRNFRSAPEVLKAVTEGFGRVFGADEARMIPADGAVSGRVRVLRLPKQTDRSRGAADRHRAALGRALAKAIAERLGAGDLKDLRDCAVLVRTGKEASIVTQALRQAGVQALRIGDRSLYNNAPAHDLLNLLAFLSDSADEATLFGLLQGPSIALPIQDLAEAKSLNLLGQILNDDHPPALPDSWPKARVLALLALRDLFRSGEYSAALTQLVEGGWCPGPWAGCSQTAANLMAIVDEFMGAWEDCDLDLRRWLAEQRQKPDAPAVTLPNDAVVVATQHSAKGLEWPFVVALSFGGSGRGKSDLALLESEGKLALRYPQGPGFGFLRRIEAQHAGDAQLESMRLAYVACTRAKRELWVVTPDDGHALSAIASRMEVAAETIALPEPANDADSPSMAVEAVPEAVPIPQEPQPYTNLATPVWRRRLRPSTVSPSQIGRGDEERLVPDDQASHRPVDPVATVLGELVHLTLELADLDRSLDEQMPGILAEAIDELQDSIPTDRAEEIALEAAAVITNLGASALWSSLSQVEVVQKELPFSCPAHWIDPDSKAELGTGFIDLIYRRPCGTYVVADWKVTRRRDREALVQDYQPQLRAYARVIRPLIGEAQLEAELLLARSAERVPVPIDA